MPELGGSDDTDYKENLQEGTSSGSSVYLVCTRGDDGHFSPRGGGGFNYVSFDVFSNGNITFHIEDGTQFTSVFYGDAYERGLLINALCGGEPFP